MKPRKRVISVLSLAAAITLLDQNFAFAAPSRDTIVETGYYNVACQSTAQGNNATVCLGDNASVGYWFENEVTTTSRDAVTRSMDGLDTTDLNTAYDSTPVTSGSGETDVMYRQNPDDFPDGSNLVGIMWCDDRVNTAVYRCDQAYVNFNGSALWATACHETGHAVGLLHGFYHDPRVSNDASEANADSPDAKCMRTPIDRYLNTYGTVNVANINWEY